MIQMDKKYRTRDGQEVRILCLDRKHDFYPVVALITNGLIIGTTIEGSYVNTSREHPYDLIEVLPYADFKIDDPVMVREYPKDNWEKRHFAGISKNGKATCFINGYSKFSCGKNCVQVEWNECRHPTKEELEGK